VIRTYTNVQMPMCMYMYMHMVHEVIAVHICDSNVVEASLGDIEQDASHRAPYLYGGGAVCEEASSIEKRGHQSYGMVVQGGVRARDARGVVILCGEFDRKPQPRRESLTPRYAGVCTHLSLVQSHGFSSSFHLTRTHTNTSKCRHKSGARTDPAHLL
jgi:hypothetical protein